MSKGFSMVFVLVLLAAACVHTAPQQRYQTGEILLEEDFSTPYNWEARRQGNVSIGVENGVYVMRSDVTQYVRGFHNQTHDNVVIEVRTRQLSMHENNAYGVICRASRGNNASGYYFLIGGDGSYSIRRGRDNDVDGLVSWTKTGAVHTGPSQNVIRAVCIDDYLALYVNGKFVADARDRSYKTGYTGFAAAVSRDGTLEVNFDDLTIWQGSLSDAQG